jgi:Na+-driven multidrug efflux pump
MNERRRAVEQGQTRQELLAKERIGKLIIRFTVPAVMSFLVNAVYNIVDQIFIGQSVGMLGNAATNVAFPLTTISTAVALLCGVGTASNFNLEMGRGNPDKAGNIVGTGITMLAVSGLVICAAVLIFLRPLMGAFGATEKVLPYALSYTQITAFGIPFAVFATGGSHLIRADGSPTFAMISIASGAVLNIFLDAFFIFGLNMGIAGAALATSIGQAVSCCLVIGYLTRFQSIHFTRAHFHLNAGRVWAICSLGAAACLNQLAMTVVQITMNQTLTHYGVLSHYGSDIPLACVGVISKLNIILVAFSVGIAQGCQPIVGFNYGAKNFARVRKTYRLAAIWVTAIATVFFLCFQLIPHEIIAIFGKGSNEYFEFATRYLRIFMLLTFINGIQPVTSNFFTSIGKANRGIFISLTRQILFLLPLILIFPLLWGIDGVMYAGPIADGVAAVLAFVFIFFEMRQMKREEDKQKISQNTP